MKVKLSLKAGILEATKVLWQDHIAELVFIVDQEAFAVGLPTDNSGKDLARGLFDFPCGSRFAVNFL